MMAVVTELVTQPNVRTRIVDVLNANTPDGDFVLAELVQKTRAYLEETDTALLEEFKDLLLDEHLHNCYGAILRSRRARGRARAKSEAFGEAIARGDFSPFDEPYPVDAESGIWRPVRYMTGTDHQFVATNYERSANTDLLLAAFHRAVAKKVGKRETGEVMTEEQYVRLYQSIVGKES